MSDRVGGVGEIKVCKIISLGAQLCTGLGGTSYSRRLPALR